MQVLAGLAAVSGSPESLDEALQLFAERRLYNFEPFHGSTDDKDLFELALAARLNRPRQAADLLARSRANGSREHFPGEGHANVVDLSA